MLSAMEERESESEMNSELNPSWWPLNWEEEREDAREGGYNFASLCTRAPCVSLLPVAHSPV